MKLSPSHKKDSGADPKDLDLERFMKEIGSPLPRGEVDRSISERTHAIPLASMESYFIFDLVKNSITEQKGMAKLFGIAKNEIQLSDILEHIHPEDLDDVSAILKEVFGQLIHAKIPLGASYLKMSFHILSGKGEKLGMISDNIVYSNDVEGMPISVLVKFLRADFMKSSATVGWWVDNSSLDRSRVEQSLDRGKSELFTPRELEILRLIHSEQSSSQIAEAFCLSEHTVITHKKNIFAKSGCHSLEELKHFCLKERIFKP